MTSTNKIRLLSVLIATCTVGLTIYKPFYSAALTDLHPAARACLSAQSTETAMTNCRAALASDELSDTERGAAAFRWAYMSDSEDWELQLELYNHAIDFFPAKIAAFYNRGMLLYKHARDYDAAAADFTEVIDRMAPQDGVFLNAYAYRARAYRKMGKNRRAMADVKIALKHDSTNLIALEEEAELLSDQKDFQGALTVLDRAITLHADDDQIVFLWEDRAWVKAKLGDREGALSDINEAMDLGSNTAWTWYWRGRLNMETGDVRAGILDLQTSLALDPTYCPALGGMRDIKSGLEKLAHKGFHALDAPAIETPVDNPYHPGHLLLQHLARAQERKKLEALDVLDQLISSERHPEFLMLLRARLYSHMGQNDLALSELEKLATSPEYYRPIFDQLSERGAELKNMGKACASRRTYRESSDFISLFSYAMREKVAVQKDQNNLEGMLESLNHWIDNVPDRNGAWVARGKILEEFGRPDEALTNYEEALRLIDSGEGHSRFDDALHIDTLFRLTSIYDDQDRSTHAQTVWDESLSIADNSVIWTLQEMMEIAGHYEGRWHGRYDQKTKVALRACLADAKCKWENISPQMR